MYNILVCDDEKDIVSALTIYLTTGGYQVFPAYDGTEALAILAKEDIHLVLLDIMMPKLDGIATMTKIREVSNVPVILLTAKSEDTDKILGLNVGADDYVTKPFRPRELVARVKARLRRRQAAPQASSTLLSAGAIEVDLRTHLATLHGEPLRLTPKEFAILAILAQSVGSPVSAADLFEGAWHERFDDAAANTVMVHIRRLREKLERNPAAPEYIITKWGVGYYFAEA